MLEDFGDKVLYFYTEQQHHTPVIRPLQQAEKC